MERNIDILIEYMDDVGDYFVAEIVALARTLL